MTTMESIKVTINNVLHANENARKLEEEKKKSRRNAIVGGGGVFITLTTSVILHRKWAKDIKSVYEKSEKDLTMKIEELDRMIKNGSSETETNVVADFEEVGGGDVNG